MQNYRNLVSYFIYIHRLYKERLSMGFSIGHFLSEGLYRLGLSFGRHYRYHFWTRAEIMSCICIPHFFWFFGFKKSYNPMVIHDIHNMNINTCTYYHVFVFAVSDVSNRFGVTKKGGFTASEWMRIALRCWNGKEESETQFLCDRHIKFVLNSSQHV